MLFSDDGNKRGGVSDLKGDSVRLWPLEAKISDLAVDDCPFKVAPKIRGAILSAVCHCATVMPIPRNTRKEPSYRGLRVNVSCCERKWALFHRHTLALVYVVKPTLLFQPSDEKERALTPTSTPSCPPKLPPKA